MPIKIPNSLPAAKILQSENIFIMDELRAAHQDIRPLKILILNLMPTKIETETQLLRLLGNTPMQVEIDLLQTVTHVAKNVSEEHLLTFYKSFAEIKDSRYDGLIITGAPVERMPFEDVDYWRELSVIMNWSNHNVYSTLHICWGAQAGLYYHYGIEKRTLPEKLTGVFRHKNLLPDHPIMRGFDDEFYVPHSRHTTIYEEDILKNSQLCLLSSSREGGVHIVADRECRRFFVTGHSEYDRETLAGEYHRDLKKEGAPPFPQGYFPGNSPENIPVVNWRAHASLLFSNWINFIVYQHTPYDLNLL